MNNHDLRQHIEQVLNKEVVPALQMDGMGIEVVDVSDGIASIRFTGICSSCPATLIPLLTGLQEELRQRVREVEYLDVVV